MANLFSKTTTQASGKRQSTKTKEEVANRTNFKFLTK